MPGEDSSPAPFEEQAALAELERLQKEIEESRRRRRQANDAFESFIRSFGTPSSPPSPSPSPPVAAEPAPEPAPRNERKAEERIAQPVTPAASNVVGLGDFLPEGFVPAPELPPPPSESALLKEIAAPPHEPSARRHSRYSAPTPTLSHDVPAALKPAAGHRGRQVGLFALGGVTLAGVAFFAWRGSHATPSSDVPPAASTAAKPAPVAPPVATPRTPLAPAPVPVAELTTSRRVWVRVVVDGDRAIERELDANVRIPLAPKQRIVLRAGDAGAVRLLLAGKDQGVLGPDGIAVTRAFVIAPAPAPR